MVLSVPQGILLSAPSLLLYLPQRNGHSFAFGHFWEDVAFWSNGMLCVQHNKTTASNVLPISIKPSDIRTHRTCTWQLCTLDMKIFFSWFLSASCTCACRTVQVYAGLRKNPKSTLAISGYTKIKFEKKKQEKCRPLKNFCSFNRASQFLCGWMEYQVCICESVVVTWMRWSLQF